MAGHGPGGVGHLELASDLLRGVNRVHRGKGHTDIGSAAEKVNFLIMSFGMRGQLVENPKLLSKRAWVHRG